VGLVRTNIELREGVKIKEYSPVEGNKYSGVGFVGEVLPAEALTLRTRFLPSGQTEAAKGVKDGGNDAPKGLKFLRPCR
jgi:hypothetical protein